MKEALAKTKVSFVTNEETAEIAQRGEGALDLPAFAIATQRASILQGGAAAAVAMGTNQLDAACGQPLAEGLGVVSAITDEPLWTGAGSPRSCARHLHSAQGFFCEGNLRRRGAKESASQRYTLAVCHHHPLRTFATFGFTHAEPQPSYSASAKPCSAWASRRSRSCPLLPKVSYSQFHN